MARHQSRSTVAYRELSALIEEGVAALTAARVLLDQIEDMPGGMKARLHSAAFKKRKDFNMGVTQPHGTLISEMLQSRLMVQDRLVELMPRAGRNGVAILQRLMDDPGVFIPSDELVRAAGIRSLGIQVVKVYICHIRQELKSNGIDQQFVETGRRSYRITTEAVSAIKSLISSPDQHS